jgi:hypothetical protein
MHPLKKIALYVTCWLLGIAIVWCMFTAADKIISIVYKLLFA